MTEATTSPPSQSASKWSGGIAHLAATISLLAFALLLTMRQNLLDLDVYHQMALFRAAIQLGHWPMDDVFAFTSKPGPSVHYEWGMGAILYAVAKLGGGMGLLLMEYLLIGLLLTIAMRVARRRGASWPAIMVLIIVPVWLLSYGFTAIRAGMLSLVFTAVLLRFLESDRRGNRKWIWFWIPLCVVWLNIHPGFVVGIGVIVLYAVESTLRQRKLPWRFLPLLAAMLPLVLINPYGILYPGAVWRAVVMMPPLPIIEWLPIWDYPDSSYSAIFFLTLLVAVYAVLRAGWRHCDGLLTLLVFALAALLHMRHCYLYALVWLCYVPGWFSTAPLGQALSAVWVSHPRWVAAAWLVLLAGMIPSLGKIAPWSLKLPVNLDPSKKIDNGLVYPAGAVNYLKQQRFQGNVMTHYNDGSYVMWELWPAVKIGLDSRNDVGYAYPVLAEISKFYWGKPGWQKTLQHYPSDLILINRSFPLAHCMTEQHDWHLVYDDDAFQLWARPGLDMPYVDYRGQPLHADFP